MFPSADVVAVALYAATREIVPATLINQHVLAAAYGRKDMGPKAGFAGGYPLSRIRILAAVALWDTHPHVSRTKIGQCVGQGYADVWAGKVERNMKLGAIAWLDDAMLNRVRAAVAWAQKRR